MSSIDPSVQRKEGYGLDDIASPSDVSDSSADKVSPSFGRGVQGPEIPKSIFGLSTFVPVSNFFHDVSAIER